MSDAWAVVIAALGASFLTGLITVGLEWWRMRKADKSALEDKRYRAYTILMTHSAYILHLATTLRINMQYRTTIQDSLRVALDIEEPFGLTKLTEILTQELKPLYAAWSEVLLVGSETAIAQANDLINDCGEVISMATRPGEAQPKWLRPITGQKWTKAQLDEWEQRQRKLADARRKFGVIARKETGMPEADLFASHELKRLTAPTKKPWYKRRPGK